MGHAVNYDSFSTKQSKDSIYAEVNRRAIYDGDYHTSITAIKWHDNVCLDSYEDAEKFIEKHDSYYGQLAVKYKEQKDFKPSKALADMQERLKQAKKAYYELDNAFHFKNHKSATVGCKECGSKIAIGYLHSNCCPVCHKDLRPESTLARILALKNKMNDLAKKCKEKEKAERLKSIKKADEYWLVKTEYHV